RRAAGTHDPESGGDYAFQGPLLRRLSAEQLWDSLLGLATGDADATLQAPGARAEPIYARHEELASLDAAALRARVERETLRTTDPAAYRRLIAAGGAEGRGQGESASRRRRAELAGRQGGLGAARGAGAGAQVVETAAALRGLRDAPPPRSAPGMARA